MSRLLRRQLHELVDAKARVKVVLDVGARMVHGRQEQTDPSHASLCEAFVRYDQPVIPRPVMIRDYPHLAGISQQRGMIWIEP
ncbi:hypothetical protein EMG21_29665, partial [Klebsiella pneumoniae]